MKTMDIIDIIVNNRLDDLKELHKIIKKQVEQAQSGLTQEGLKELTIESGSKLYKLILDLVALREVVDILGGEISSMYSLLKSNGFDGIEEMEKEMDKKREKEIIDILNSKQSSDDLFDSLFESLIKEEEKEDKPIIH